MLHLVGLKIVFLLDQSAIGHANKPNRRPNYTATMPFQTHVDVKEKETTKGS